LTKAVFFAVLLIVVSAISIWAWQARAHLQHRLLTLWGASVTLGAFVLLPWIHFEGPDYFDRQLERLWQDSGAQRLIESAPRLRELLGSGQPGNSDDFIHLLPTPELQQMAAIARSHQQITGFELWRSIPRHSTVFHVTLAVALILPAAMLLWSLLSLVADIRTTNRGAAALSSVFALITLFFVLWYVPRVDTFGVRDELLVVAIGFLSGSRTGPGIWWTLLGLGMIVTGGVVEISQAGLEPKTEEGFW